MTAILDQAEAAATHAAAIMEAVSRSTRLPVTQGRPGPVMETIVGRLAARALRAELTLCPHLNWTAPQPSSWIAWAPGRLRCQACTGTQARRIKGTREDRRCDHCKRVVAVISSVMVQLPPVVADLPPRPPACIPPVAVHAGLCGDCKRADASPSETEAERSA